jgi:hypothetical protein
MSAARKVAVLIGLGVLMLVGAIIVWSTSRQVDVDILAGVAVLGGIACVVITLPTNGSNGKR